MKKRKKHVLCLRFYRIGSRTLNLILSITSITVNYENKNDISHLGSCFRLVHDKFNTFPFYLLRRPALRFSPVLPTFFFFCPVPVNPRLRVQVHDGFSFRGRVKRR